MTKVSVYTSVYTSVLVRPFCGSVALPTKFQFCTTMHCYCYTLAYILLHPAVFKGSQADAMLGQFYKSVQCSTEGYWTYMRRNPPTYFYVFDKPVAATDADMNTHFNLVQTITSPTEKILPSHSCIETILDLDMTIVYMKSKSRVGEFKALDEISIPKQMLNDVLCVCNSRSI